MTNNILTKPDGFTQKQFERLKEAILFLSEKQKYVLHLRFWENKTIGEISRKIGTSWAATDQMIDSTVNHLRIRLMQEPEFAMRDPAISASKVQKPVAA